MSSFLSLSPAIVIVAGAFLAPLIKAPYRNWFMLALPFVAFAMLLAAPNGEFGHVQLLSLELITLRIDGWSRVFSYVFLLATALSVIYAWHLRDAMQQVAGLVYAGSAVGAVLAGDLLTLFIFWEGTALSSVLLIWASRTQAAYRAGARYLVIQFISGLLLLSGALILYYQTGSLRFDQIPLDGLGGWLLLVAFGIKCAFPLLHNWLADAYPRATITGTVFLSAFTTKLAVYTLARGFAGTPDLIWIGALMAVFPVFYGVIENDLRRVLAYSLNTQLGFMVVGIGVGTELALNGTAALAFSGVLYQALLFMSMGAVLFRTGTANASDLGDLYRSMPWTARYCIVGAASVSAFPLFSGFVSKALLLSAVASEGHFGAWAALLFAAVGMFHHTGTKIPYFAFFARGKGLRCEEAPRHMLIAMGIAAAFCIGIGVAPGAFYSLLPFAVDYSPYTGAHIVTQMQLLTFAALTFAILIWLDLYPAPRSTVSLDTDYFYRRTAPALVAHLRGRIQSAWTEGTATGLQWLSNSTDLVKLYVSPSGILGRSWATGTMVFWATLLIGATLLFQYL